MKALRRVKSFEGLLASFFSAKMGVGTHHHARRGCIALGRSRQGRVGVLFSPVRDFSLAAVGLQGDVFSIVHLLVHAVSS
jgi:hypothetical protein